MVTIYDVSGNLVGFVDFDKTIKGIAHRGFSSVAPENTLPAYKLAKEKGFFYVECDVALTSDNVPVLLHDSTINRTSNGTGNINSLTWEQVQTYDFGSWKSSDYAGTKIPSFEQFISLCKNLGLHPYIEIKSTQTFTEAQVQGLVDIVKSYGMDGKVTWISFSDTYLGYVKSYDEKARLGYVVETISSSEITKAQALKLPTNEVCIDGNYTNLTDTRIGYCITADIPLEVWTVDSDATIKSLNPYISGVTSNSLIAGRVLYEDSMS